MRLSVLDQSPIAGLGDRIEAIARAAAQSAETIQVEAEVEAAVRAVPETPAA